VRRITVDEVKAAYEKTGLKPQKDNWFSDDFRCACAIGALFAAAYPEVPNAPGSVVQQWAYREFGADYVDEFVGGFDCPQVPLDNLIGDLDGRAVAAAIFGEVQS